MTQALIASKCCVIYQVRFIANYWLICIYAKYLLPFKVNVASNDIHVSSHLKTHGAVVICVKRVEQEMCVCGSICGKSRNTGDLPASKS